MPARLEERMVTIALPGAEGAALEGIFVASVEDAVRGALVAAPHPLYGGSMDSPVVNEVAHACARLGRASLRFNWRGVGASAGAPSGESADADADVDAALAHLAETVPGPLAACGYSFGAAAVLRAVARHPRIDRLVLVAPPPALVGVEGFARAGRPLLVVVGEADRMAPPVELRRALSDVPDATLEVIPHADHFFAAGLAPLGQCVRAWLGAR